MNTLTTHVTHDVVAEEPASALATTTAEAESRTAADAETQTDTKPEAEEGTSSPAGPVAERPNEPAETAVGSAPVPAAKGDSEAVGQGRLDPRRPIQIQRGVLEQILASPIARCVPEKGGLLGGKREEALIRRFYYDTSGDTSRVAYSPNTDVIDEVLEEWDADGGDRMIGFLHSHPGGFDQLSEGDCSYAARILRAIPALDRLFLPIAIFRQPSAHSTQWEFRITPYVGFLTERGEIAVERVVLQILDEQGGIEETTPLWSRRVPAPVRETAETLRQETFVRVVEAYDLDRLERCRVVAVGVGGAADYVECLARAGVGQFVLIDRDTVSVPNLATQQTYRRDLGRSKVGVLRTRLNDINPAAEVVPLTCFLDDLNDEAMEKLLLEPLTPQGEAPVQTVLCGLTDSFAAQARVNRLALQFAVPSLCAQVYQEGRGAEVTFTHPDLTPACHRCALSGRYLAHEKGEVKPVASVGTPIFATVRLNALKGFLTLGLLHAGTDHPRWGKLLVPATRKNLVLIRMDPDLGQNLGLTVFDRTFGDANSRIYFDETIWTTITPDDGTNGSARCPDCGGTGCLRDWAGSYVDTITGKRQHGIARLAQAIQRGLILGATLASATPFF